MFNQFRSLALAIQEKFNKFDPSVKSRFVDDNILNSHPPIFIIGSPRAGSTLLFQVLCSQFQLSYISNIMAAFPSMMIRMLRYVPSVATGYTGQIRMSKYGYVPGLVSPNESGKILAKWFEKSPNPDHDKYIRNTFAAITGLSGAPVVLKNQNRLTVNIDKLEAIFSNARYIAIERDPLYNAQSLLIARREVLGNERSWFSAKPPGYERILDRDPYYQVVWQVLALQEIVKEKSQTIPGQRFYDLDYEDFCNNPALHLRRIQKQFDLTWKPGSDPDGIKLTASKKIKLAQHDWDKLEDAYRIIKESK